MADKGIDPASYYDFAWGAYGEFGALRYMGDQKFLKSLHEKLQRQEEFKKQDLEDENLNLHK